jgi:transcriptional regulator with XRE-family HTH domain
MIGAEIRKSRGARTQTEVARAAGISKSYLCDIEKGSRTPPPGMIDQLAEVLGEEPDRWLWMWVEEQMGADLAAKALRHAVAG